MIAVSNLEGFQNETSSPASTIGVYSIICAETGKSYTGWSRNVRSRLSTHRSMLRTGKHPRLQMQEDFNRHGATSFTFTVISTYGSEEEAQMHEATLISDAFKADRSYNGIVPANVTESLRGRKERRKREEASAAAQAEEKQRAVAARVEQMKRVLIEEWRSDLICKVRMRNDDKGLLVIVERFLECARVQREEFGLAAVGDAGFVDAIRAPGAAGVSLRLANKVYDYIESYMARFDSDGRDYLPLLDTAEKLVVMDCRRWESWLSHARKAAA